jgi:hypothetical protein
LNDYKGIYENERDEKQDEKPFGAKLEIAAARKELP